MFSLGKNTIFTKLFTTPKYFLMIKMGLLHIYTEHTGVSFQGLKGDGMSLITIVITIVVVIIIIIIIIIIVIVIIIIVIVIIIIIIVILIIIVMKLASFVTSCMFCSLFFFVHCLDRAQDKKGIVHVMQVQLLYNQ